MTAKVSTVPQNYGVGRWGEGYFGINAAGHATVLPDPDGPVEIDLYDLAGDLVDNGLRLPVLVRFNDLLQHRLQALCGAFEAASRQLEYRGGYRAVYPIKVNQQRSVIEQLVAGGERVGLEAGSKPELMVVLAAAPRGGTIVCNGYKDREYIRLALIGRRLGYAVYIVIEKPGELDMVLAEAAQLGIEPQIGVRVRLAAVASGNWQNSGGARSKFGLSAAQVLAMARNLAARGRLHWLTMLHAHIGSQIPDLGDIRRGIQEMARFFVELCHLGAPVSVVDVGGGLGVDYEGSRSKNFCSLDYGLDDYALEVLRPLARACAEHGLPQPSVFSESGRALTAHHAVLITDVIDREAGCADMPQAGVEADELLARLDGLRQTLDEGMLPQLYRRAQDLLAEAHERFAQGDMDLPQRAYAESLFFDIARGLRRALRLNSRRHRELLDQLEALLADRVFCNFSLFQSCPDAWAIDQVFPVMPLQRLNEAPDQVARIHDLTCDSDGSINRYVDQDGVESEMLLHARRPGEPYLLGIFLVGAYQEILGDMHNLFGDTDAVDVSVDAAGRYRLGSPERGDAVDELLRYLHFEPDDMLETYRRRLREQGACRDQADACLRELRAALEGYTYVRV